MKSSQRRPNAMRPRDRFYDEKLRMLGRPVEEASFRDECFAGSSAKRVVMGVSLLGVTALMAAPPVTEVPAGQPLEAVADQAAGALSPVPNAGQPTADGLPAGTGTVPLVPQIGTVPEPITPPLSLPVNPPSSAASGASPEGELVPLDAPGLVPASEGEASLAGEDRAAVGASVEEAGARLDGSREVDRETLEQIQGSGEARPWVFSLMGGVTYDDNILFQQGDGGQVSDIILNTGFNSSYQLRGGSVLRAVDAALGGSYMTYTENSEYSGWNATAQLSGDVSYGEFRGSVNLMAAQLNGANRMVGGFAVTRNFSGSLSGSYDISEKTRLTGAVSLAIVDFEEQSYQTQPFSGSTSMNASLGANYAITAKTRLGGNYTWTANEQQDFSTWSYSSLNATAAWSATAKTSFSGSIGWQVTSLSGVESGGGPGWIGTLGGSWQASERTALTLDFTRSAAAAAVGGNGAMNFNALNAGVSHKLTERLSGAVRVGYRAESYEDLEGTDEFQGRDVTYWTIDASLTWRITERAALMGTYQFQDNRSSFDTWNFSGNRVGVNFTYSF